MAHDVDAELSLDRLKILLASPCETDRLDFKESLDLSNPRDIVELAKDILAMANSGGGHLVIGIEDGTRRQRGITSEAAAALRDAKSINDKLKKYCGGYVRVYVSQLRRFPRVTR